MMPVEPPSNNRRIALVTGAGSGIGQAVALALVRDGWTTVLSGRRPGPLEETARQGVSNCIPIPCDVTDEASISSLFARIEAQFGRLDLLFNNAGIASPATPIEGLSLEEWQSVIDTNLTGAFLCARAAFRLMKAQRPRGGRIINSGSISATSPRPQMISYTASKHAITGLTKGISLEGRPHDIACGQIDIGNASTELASLISHDSVRAAGQSEPEPVFHVKHVAEAILYMAGLPLDANVLSMTVMATKMPYIGRG